MILKYQPLATTPLLQMIDDLENFPVEFSLGPNGLVPSGRFVFENVL